MIQAQHKSIKSHSLVEFVKQLVMVSDVLKR